MARPSAAERLDPRSGHQGSLRQLSSEISQQVRPGTRTGVRKVAEEASSIWLDRVDTNQLHRTWTEAIADYVVDMSAMIEHRIWLRADKSDVDGSDRGTILFPERLGFNSRVDQHEMDGAI